jgi:hypothetical protein
MERSRGVCGHSDFMTDKKRQIEIVRREYRRSGGCHIGTHLCHS